MEMTLEAFVSAFPALQGNVTCWGPWKQCWVIEFALESCLMKFPLSPGHCAPLDIYLLCRKQWEQIHPQCCDRVHQVHMSTGWVEYGELGEELVDSVTVMAKRIMCCSRPVSSSSGYSGMGQALVYRNSNQATHMDTCSPLPHLSQACHPY